MSGQIIGHLRKALVPRYACRRRRAPIARCPRIARVTRYDQPAHPSRTLLSLLVLPEFRTFIYLNVLSLLGALSLGSGLSRGSSLLLYSVLGSFYSRFVIDSLISLATQCSASLLAWLPSNRPLNWNLILPRSTPWSVHSIGFAQPNEVLI